MRCSSQLVECELLTRFRLLAEALHACVDICASTKSCSEPCIMHLPHSESRFTSNTANLATHMHHELATPQASLHPLQRTSPYTFGLQNRIYSCMQSDKDTSRRRSVHTHSHSWTQAANTLTHREPRHTHVRIKLSYSDPSSPL